MTKATVTITAVPPDTGTQPINGVDYRINGGTRTASPLSSPWTGTFDIDPYAYGDGVEISYTNSVDADPDNWSDVKAISLATAPTNFAVSPGDALNNLSWGVPVDDGSASVNGYQIESNVASAGWTIIQSNWQTLAYEDSPLTNGVTVAYRVAAVTNVGVGASTAAISGTPQAPATEVPVITDTSWDNATKTVGFTVSLPSDAIICTGTAANTPDGNGGWTNATVEDWVEPVTGSTSFSITITDESVTKLTYYCRNVVGDSVEVITEDISFGVASGTMTVEGNFLQGNNISGTGAETTSGAFATAGKYLVGITELCDAYNAWTLTGSDISIPPVQLDIWSEAGSPETNTRVYEVDTDGPSDLTITQTSGGSSFKRGVHIVKLDGLTTTGNISGTNGSSSHPTELGTLVTLDSVPASYWVFSIACSRSAEATSCTWQNSYAGTDTTSDIALNATSRTTSAMKETTILGDFLAQPVFVGRAAGGQRSTLAIAVGAG